MWVWTKRDEILSFMHSRVYVIWLKRRFFKRRQDMLIFHWIGDREVFSTKMWNLWVRYVAHLQWTIHSTVSSMNWSSGWFDSYSRSVWSIYVWACSHMPTTELALFVLLVLQLRLFSVVQEDMLDLNSWRTSHRDAFMSWATLARQTFSLKWSRR